MKDHPLPARSRPDGGGKPAAAGRTEIHDVAGHERDPYAGRGLRRLSVNRGWGAAWTPAGTTVATAASVPTKTAAIRLDADKIHAPH
ncbi:hypothetical protein Pflav_011530 [Phytohabitans flavus]|uniref:Uncharacterized protein n=1 Tax=Phytohabitans flavus TaxID=1076124 RepID=A0A6F8XLQ9_9ACTN|nr:hypothetical protein Pflav_011530 [Phytohabitans flavus]